MIFKAGDLVEITSEPSLWSGALSNKCPLFKILKYPYRLVIEKIEGSAMLGNGYGWSLDTLIKERKIKLVGKRKPFNKEEMIL